MSVDIPDDLYGLALDRFIPERAALVTALRGEKRREEASRVAALRKPSVAAWAVNQLVRTQPKTIQALFAAGDELARAQADAVAGQGGGEAMREATHRQRDPPNRPGEIYPRPRHPGTRATARREMRPSDIEERS